MFPSRVAVLVDSSASMTLPDGPDAAAPGADGRVDALPAGSRAARAVELLATEPHRRRELLERAARVREHWL